MVSRSERESILRGIRGAKRVQRDLRLDMGPTRAQRVDVFGSIARMGATLMFQPLEPSRPLVAVSVSIGRWPRYSIRRKTSSRDGASTSPLTMSPAWVSAR